MKYYIYIILALTFLHSQHDHHDHNHDHEHHHSASMIVGTIISSNDSEPIEYASVNLLDNKSSEIIMGQASLVDGRFKFNHVHQGEYKIVIAFMGFETWESEVIFISDDSVKDLGTISLKIKSIESDTVSITQQRDAYEFKADKIIYNPDKDIIASNGSAEDVLSKTPLVSVDQDGEVSLRGNSNVNILIDGRKARLDLASIAGIQIEKVEVITSPSAKYDPEGMAGIINIVMKKGTKDGFNGNLKFNARHNQYYSLDKMNGLNFYGNYRKGKLNLFSSMGLNNRNGNRSGYRNMTTSFYENIDSIDPDTTLKTWYSSKTAKDRKFLNFKLGADYYLNEYLTISSELRADHHNKKSKTTQSFTEPEPMEEVSIDEDNSDDPNIDIEYLFVIDREYQVPDKSLSFSVLLHQGHDNENVILITDEDNKITNFDAIHGGVDTDFIYEFPIKNNSFISFGYDGRYVDNSEIMSFEKSVLFNDIDLANDIDVIENEFIFERNLQGLFVEYENELSKKFSIQPSLRLEFVNRKVSFNTNFEEQEIENSIFDDLFNQANNQNYDLDTLEVYPYLNMTYNLAKNESIQFGIGRRVERPGGAHGSWQVMPFPTNVYNEQFIFVGNPYLEPEYSNQYDLNYSRPIPMGFASLSLFHHDIENRIEWYDDDQYGELGDVLTFRNVDEAKSTGISFFGMIMGQSLGGSYTKTTQKDISDPDDIELNEESERFNLFGKIRLPEEYIKIFDFEFGFYWMDMKSPTGNFWGNSGTTWADLGISKSFMDDRITASFTIDNIFDSGGFQMVRTKPVNYFDPDLYGYAEETTDVFNTRNGRTYKFNIKFQLGKKVDGRKKKFERGHSHDGQSGMDMGY